MKGEFVEGKISVGRYISGDSKGRRGNGRHCDAGHRTTRDILLIFYRQTAPERSPLFLRYVILMHDVSLSFSLY